MKTIGILGAGQLGLMLAEAAHALGVRVVVFAPPGDNIAFRAADVAIEADYKDWVALERFAHEVGADGAVTLEFENVPVGTLAWLEEHGATVHPGSEVLEVAQDRFLEKRLARELSISTPTFCNMMDAFDPSLRIGEPMHCFPGIVKTARNGYDGKGQLAVPNVEYLREHMAQVPRVPCILERKVNFDFELSVIVARNLGGEELLFPAVRNQHGQGILRKTSYEQKGIPQSIADQATDYTLRLARHLRVVGLLAVEFFAAEDGVLFNEMAPRPHNSGHWTIEGCKTSQFAACVQAVLGLPFTPINPARKATMLNLIGSEVAEAPYLAERGHAVHVYGKAEVRDGRKMGHATLVEF